MARKPVNVTLRAFPKAMKRLDMQIQKATRDACVETAMYGVTQVTRMIGRTKPKPVASNTFRQAWVWKAFRDGAIIGNPTEQAYFVEVGRRPGKAPPYAAILEWVKMKRLVKASDMRTKRKPKKPKSVGEQADDTLKALGKKHDPKKPRRAPKKNYGRDLANALKAVEAAPARKAKAQARKRASKAALAGKKRRKEAAVALLVMMKIKHRGTKGRFPLLNTMPKINKFFDKELKHQVRQVLKAHRG